LVGEGRNPGKLHALLVASAESTAGDDWEGPPPPATNLDEQAATVVALLGNGMGGLDWAGLETVAAYLEIDDIEGLMQRIHVIKLNKTKQEN
jgi:hypothetical protein